MPRKSTLNLPKLYLGEESIGQRAKRLRQELGITQIELAKMIGITQGMVSEYESDKLSMNPEMICRFALALQITTDDLLGFNQDRKFLPEKPNFKFTRAVKRLEQLPPTGQDKVIEIMKIFLTSEEQKAGISPYEKAKKIAQKNNKNKTKRPIPPKPKSQAYVKSIAKKKRNPHEWNDEEREFLEIFFPKSPREIILDTLSGKTWADCLNEAERLGIKRYYKEPVTKGRPKKRKTPKYNLSKKELTKYLHTTALTIEEIATKMKTTPDIVRRHIFKWDL